MTNRQQARQNSSSPTTSHHRPTDVRLRDVQPQDLPALFEFQLDPDANRMAATYPRSADDFNAHWAKLLVDANVVAKAIVVGESLAGCISCFKVDGLNHVGYWLGKPYWGHGTATRALELLLQQVSHRPLGARVAVTNGASLRVLQKCGFAIVRYQSSPATERFAACEEAVLELNRT